MKVLSHAFSKFYFLLNEWPRASYMFFRSSGECPLIESALSTSRTPGTVLQGLNNICWYSAKRKTQSHKTKERDCGHALWFLGKMCFTGWERVAGPSFWPTSKACMPLQHPHPAHPLPGQALIKASGHWSALASLHAFLHQREVCPQDVPSEYPSLCGIGCLSEILNITFPPPSRFSNDPFRHPGTLSLPLKKTPSFSLRGVISQVPAEMSFSCGSN